MHLLIKSVWMARDFFVTAECGFSHDLRDFGWLGAVGVAPRLNGSAGARVELDTIQMYGIQ